MPLQTAKGFICQVGETRRNLEFFFFLGRNIWLMLRSPDLIKEQKFIERAVYWKSKPVKTNTLSVHRVSSNSTPTRVGPAEIDCLKKKSE